MWWHWWLIVWTLNPAVQSPWNNTTVVKPNKKFGSGLIYNSLKAHLRWVETMRLYIISPKSLTGCFLSTWDSCNICLRKQAIDFSQHPADPSWFYLWNSHLSSHLSRFHVLSQEKRTTRRRNKCTQMNVVGVLMVHCSIMIGSMTEGCMWCNQTWGRQTEKEKKKFMGHYSWRWKNLLSGCPSSWRRVLPQLCCSCLN